AWRRCGCRGPDASTSSHAGPAWTIFRPSDRRATAPPTREGLRTPRTPLCPRRATCKNPSRRTERTARALVALTTSCAVHAGQALEHAQEDLALLGRQFGEPPFLAALTAEERKV